MEQAPMIVEGRPMAPISLEAFFLHLIDKVESLRVSIHRKRSMRDEIRTLEFWRAIIAECLATFFFVFLLCGAHIVWPPMPLPLQGVAVNMSPSLITVALTCGLSMATLSQCFGHISGAHVNPAVTFAMFVTQKVTPLRALLYITAQCGGAIAGAALLYGVTIPGHQGNLGSTLTNDQLNPWQAFGVEFVLTFVVVFTVFATLDSSRKALGSDSLSIGLAYLACSFTGLPSSGASLNPARSLGPAFVMNKWTNHWVYWFGPIAGGLLAGLIYEYIFDTKKTAKTIRDALDELDRDSTIEDDYEDPDSSKITKYGTTTGGHHQVSAAVSNYHRTGNYDVYRPAGNTYSPTPSSTYPASTESTYGAHSNLTGTQTNYSAGVYGTRYTAGGVRNVPGRMEYGPSSTKF